LRWFKACASRKDPLFESYGCAVNIAAASILTEMVKGKSLRRAWVASWKDVTKALGGLPSVKFHCGALAVGALRRAVRTYYEQRGQKPEWLPEKPTLEERRALEAEELAKALAGRLGVEEG